MVLKYIKYMVWEQIILFYFHVFQPHLFPFELRNMILDYYVTQKLPIILTYHMFYKQ